MDAHHGHRVRQLLDVGHRKDIEEDGIKKRKGWVWAEMCQDVLIICIHVDACKER